ncbi:MAG: RNA polymerase sigma factor [Myxococcota bacterium]
MGTPIRDRSHEPCLARLRSGDGRALEQWTRSRAGALLGLARRHLRDELASDKLVRDVLLRALQALADGVDEAASTQWLRQRAIEAVLEAHRGRLPEHGSIERLLPRFRFDGSHREEPEPWRLTCGDGALARRVECCIDRLPEPHRAILMLSDGENLAASTIARGLATSEERVKTTLHEARLCLRTLLDPLLRGRATNSTP